jgi:hypothetical protein
LFSLVSIILFLPIVYGGFWCDLLGIFCTLEEAQAESNQIIAGVNQSTGKISFFAGSRNINATLSINVTNSFVSATDNNWVKLINPKTYKFGWNRTFAIAPSLSDRYFPARYVIDSDVPLSIEDSKIISPTISTPTRCGSVGCDYEVYESLDFSDICTNEAKCKFTQLRSNSIQVDFLFFFNATSRFVDIDPSLKITDVSVAAAELLNVTAENNFTHLSIGNNDFINSTNLVAYYPFDTNTSSTLAYDYTSNDNDGTYISNAFLELTGGYFGGFLNVNLTSAPYLKVPHHSSMNSTGTLKYTVTAWVRARVLITLILIN